jgi:hypothetical protein
MKKTFCDRCGIETEEVKDGEVTVLPFPKPDGTLGTEVHVEIHMENFLNRDKKFEFCKECFFSLVALFLDPKRQDERDELKAKQKKEEDIPF